MASLATVFADVVPDFSTFGPKVKRELPRHIPNDLGKNAGKKVGNNFGNGFLGGFKGIAVGLGGIFAGVGLARAFGTMISEAREAGKVTRITENAIRATGGAAKVSAKQVGVLSEAISNKTGIDDEAVQSGANLLLTFKNIRNEVGKGNNIFDQATAAAQDLSAAGFGSAESAAKMLGKALNDPLKGLTALSKAGVTFTDQQKEQIKTLVEQGDVLGAQKIIMQEIQTQVGGAAEAAADPMQKLGVIVANLAEQLGTALLPAISAAADWLGPKLVTGAKAVTDFFSQTLVPGIDAVTQGFKDGEDPVEGFAGFMFDLGVNAKTVADLFEDHVWPVIKDFGNFLKDTVVPQLKDMADFVKRNSDFFGPFAASIAVATVALYAYNTAVGIAAVLTGLISIPITVAVLAIAGLVAGLVFAYKHSLAFRLQVKGMGIVVREVFEGIWMTIQAAGRIIGIVFGGIKTGIESVISFFQNLGRIWDLAWDGMKEAARDGVRTVIDFFLDMAGKVLGAATTAFGWIPGIGGKLKDAKAKFAEFRDSVNASLGGLKDQTIAIRMSAQSDASILASARSRGQARTGGPIRGPGTGTSDTAGLWELSNGEHVWTAREVANAGGHAAMLAMRKQFANPVVGLAKGGPVGFDISALDLPETRGALTRWATAHRDDVTAGLKDRWVTLTNQEWARMAAAQAATSTGPADRRGWMFPLPGGKGRWPVTQGLHPVNAIDYGAPSGTPIFASFSGTLRTANLGNRSYGRYFRLTGPRGSILGAHLSSFTRGDGPITQGAMIGRVGSSGNSTGSHLHLENFGGPGHGAGGGDIHYHFPNYIGSRDELVREIDSLTRKGRIR